MEGRPFSISLQATANGTVMLEIATPKMEGDPEGVVFHLLAEFNPLMLDKAAKLGKVFSDLGYAIAHGHAPAAAAPSAEPLAVRRRDRQPDSRNRRWR